MHFASGGALEAYHWQRQDRKLGSGDDSFGIRRGSPQRLGGGAGAPTPDPPSKTMKTLATILLTAAASSLVTAILPQQAAVAGRTSLTPRERAVLSYLDTRVGADGSTYLVVYRNLLVDPGYSAPNAPAATGPSAGNIVRTAATTPNITNSTANTLLTMPSRVDNASGCLVTAGGNYDVLWEFGTMRIGHVDNASFAPNGSVHLGHASTPVYINGVLQ